MPMRPGSQRRVSLDESTSAAGHRSDRHTSVCTLRVLQTKIAEYTKGYRCLFGMKWASFERWTSSLPFYLRDTFGRRDTIPSERHVPNGGDA